MKGKNVIIILLLCGLCGFAGYMIGKDSETKIDKNTIEKENNNKEKNKKEAKKDNAGDNKNTKVKKDKNTSGISALDKAVGEWGYCAGEYDCYELIFSKDNNKYVYNLFKMWSEPGGSGIVVDVKESGDEKYKLTIHVDAMENDMVSVPEQTYDVTFDYSNLSSNILKINGKSYKKVVGDTQEFFESLFK